MEAIKKYQYCIIEHIWRALRATFVLAGTALWLDWTEPKSCIIFGLFFIAGLVDQFHGYIGHRLEIMLGYIEQHEDLD